MTKKEVLKYIQSHPDVMHGLPCIKGTRIPVAQIPSMIADGMTISRIIKEYPSLTKEMINASLKYSSYTCNFEIVSL